MDSLQELEKSGDASSAEASALRREVNQLDSDRKKIRDDFRILSLREVSDLEMKLASSLFILKEKQDVLDHTFIKSPLDGTINQLNVNTVGGVLRPGDELLRISPANNRYFVEIQIRPSDVGALKSGLTASVKFDAYDSSIYGSLKGVLNYVSAEPIFSQSANGQSSSYYVGRITLLEDQTNRRLSKNILRPGLSTVIDIKTGERSVLTFLLKPIIKSFSGALEQR
ncbi:MAG: HlyD family efflux transporter periplasmic adaptor subunit [Rhodobacteraceae bacterium]|nr:HlyD family efflux transporter periplasmic adaptor subunit [Paracoccaceae bacterium]